MRFKDGFFRRYLQEAPVALAIERSLECMILSKQAFERPILDVGCGEGMFAYVLFDEKLDVGIDPDGRELERAAQYGMYDELIRCDGASIAKPAASFRTILSNSVLEHIPEIEPVLREAHRLLAPDGRFYVTVPTNLFDRYSVIYQALSALGLRGLAESYRVFFNGFWKHYHYHDREGWARLFGGCGFEVLASQEYCPRTVAVLDDASAPLALPSFVAKKTLNRWFFVPALRRVSSAFLDPLFRPFVNVRPGEDAGGIIFFSLRRSA